MSRRILLALLGLVVPILTGAAAAVPGNPVSDAIDADVWRPVAQSVADGDIVAMGRVYHPEAVLVSTKGTRPIRSVLPEWGNGIAANKASGARATVEFRFAQRQDDAETAFETGVFKYTLTDRNGKATSSYTRMEALLVRHEGKWRLMMERQLDAVSEATWNAMTP